jgi:hypothetical protein
MSLEDYPQTLKGVEQLRKDLKMHQEQHLRYKKGYENVKKEYDEVHKPKFIKMKNEKEHFEMENQRYKAMIDWTKVNPKVVEPWNMVTEQVELEKALKRSEARYTAQVEKTKKLEAELDVSAQKEEMTTLLEENLLANKKIDELKEKLRATKIDKSVDIKIQELQVKILNLEKQLTDRVTEINEKDKLIKHQKEQIVLLEGNYQTLQDNMSKQNKAHGEQAMRWTHLQNEHTKLIVEVEAHRGKNEDYARTLSKRELEIIELRKELNLLRQQLKAQAGTPSIKRKDDDDDNSAPLVSSKHPVLSDQTLLNFDAKLNHMSKTFTSDYEKMRSSFAIAKNELEQEVKAQKDSIEHQINADKEDRIQFQKTAKKYKTKINGLINRITNAFSSGLTKEIQDMDKVIETIFAQKTLIDKPIFLPELVSSIVAIALKHFEQRITLRDNYELDDLRDGMMALKKEHAESQGLYIKMTEEYFKTTAELSELKKVVHTRESLNSRSYVPTNEYTDKVVKNNEGMRGRITDTLSKTNIKKDPLTLSSVERQIWRELDELELTNEEWVIRCRYKEFLSDTKRMPYDSRMCQGEWSRQKNVNTRLRTW